MPIRVLMADDSECMLSALRRVLTEESQIEIAGETNSFTSTLAKVADAQPDVLVLDLHLPECADFGSQIVREKLAGLKRIVAISFSNDEEAKMLAQSYGAAVLLDKMKLYTELIPAIVNASDAETSAEPASSKASAARTGR
jgi:two-component system invasion response regulator UvrY